MPCFSPLDGWRHKDHGGFTASRKDAIIDRPLTVSCGQCMGCRLEQSRQWAVRCIHEAQCHDENSFVTLTFDDDNLPYGASLRKTDPGKFVRALRDRGISVRYYACGEYGDETLRPHYHLCLFGYRPTDGKLYSEKNGIPLYTSEYLSGVWGQGHVTFGELTFETAAYTARYVTKKMTGPKAEDHYAYIEPITGLIIQRTPEFCVMSRRPGIGKPWLEKFGTSMFEKDRVIMRGKEMRVPRAYDLEFEQTDPETWKAVRRKRRQKQASKKPDARVGTYNLYKAQTVIAKQRAQQRNQV